MFSAMRGALASFRRFAMVRSAPRELSDIRFWLAPSRVRLFRYSFGFSRAGRRQSLQWPDFLGQQLWFGPRPPARPCLPTWQEFLGCVCGRFAITCAWFGGASFSQFLDSRWS